MKLADADSPYDPTCGAIIIVIPDKLAFYHPERDDLRRKPFKLLFHQGLKCLDFPHLGVS
jgi:hypothetical protein